MEHNQNFITENDQSESINTTYEADKPETITQINKKDPEEKVKRFLT